MTDEEESALIINIDKNLGVLLSRFAQETKLTNEFKSEVKAINSDQEARLRDAEGWIAITKVKHDNEKFIKHTVIKWVVANLLTTASAVVGIIYVVTTKGL